MSFIELKNACFTYPDSKRQTIKNISLDIEKGSFTAIIGHNGSGKSTLSKLICGILLPDSGSITVDTLDTKDENSFISLRRKCGMVFQNPDNQIVATIVEEDVAFAPENLGIEREKIYEIVADCLETVGMSEYRMHSTTKLSGGQKQKIAIAGVLAMNPECIVFDEATAMLDPKGRADVMATLSRLNREKGITVITVTHYMNEVCTADRVLVMNNGELVMDSTPRDIFSRPEKLSEYKLAAPQITQLMLSLKNEGVALPDGIIHTMEAAEEIEKIHTYSSSSLPTVAAELPDGQPAIELKDVSVVYGEGTPFRRVALNNISVKFPEGKVIGIIGHTGSGKSTLARLLNGLLKPGSGKVLVQNQDIWEKPKEIGKIRSKVGLVFQYPEYQLFEETVYKDIAFGPKNMGMSGEELDSCIRRAAGFCGLGDEELNASPFDISGGQKRRAAIAGVLAMNPSVLVLDEPAAGLDPHGRDKILGGLFEFRKQNNSTIILISHSMEDVAQSADYILVMGEGKVLAYGAVHEIFRNTNMLFESGLDVPQITKLFVELEKRGVVSRSDIYTIPKAMQILLPCLPTDKEGGTTGA